MTLLFTEHQHQFCPTTTCTPALAQFSLWFHQGNVLAVYVAFNKQSSSWWGAKEQGKRSVCHQGQQLLFFSSEVSLTCHPDVVYWGDLAVMQGENNARITPDIISQVIWNTFEQNFHHEICQLDRHLLPAAWASISEASLHVNLICCIFPDDSNGLVISTGMPSPSNLGLVADNWQDHLKYMEAL